MRGPHSAGPMGQKPKLNMKSIKKILRYMDRYAVLMILSIILSIGAAVITIIGPDKIKDLTNEIMDTMFKPGGINLDTISKIAIGLIVLYVLSAVFSYLQQFIMATITQRTAKRLRSDMDNKLYRLPLSFFDKSSRGDILSKVTNDVDTISQTLSNSIATIFSSIVLFFGLIFMMFKTNWVLAIVTMISSSLGMVFIPLIMKKSQKFFIGNQMLLGKLNGQIEEVYTNHNVVKSFNGVEQEKEIFNETSKKLKESNWKSQFFSGLMHPIMMLVGNLSYILIFFVGSILYLNNFTVVSLGTIMSFVIYSKLFSSPLQQFAQSLTSIQHASAAADRVFNLLEEKEMEEENHLDKKIEVVEGNIEFRDVRFGYTEDIEIIHGFTTSIKSGQKVAIVGPTGAGKTTIVNLLMKFYNVTSGDIVIDGISINEMKREDIHDLFDMILQDTWLFKGTLRENLVYNKQNVSDETLDKVCEVVGLKHFVKSLPNGYDTFLDESAQLSEGQKQQITIARAMIKDAPLLILDEATSSVDTRTELIIQKAMDELTKGKTSFVIAHRLSTIKNADLILVIKDGDIIEQGNHELLLSKNGFYAELYNSQFQDV